MRVARLGSARLRQQIRAVEFRVTNVAARLDTNEAGGLKIK